MSRKNYHHPCQLPDNIAHWETNFTEMKHKVIDYLKKHTQAEIYPIVDARYYLILNSNNKNLLENPSLSCVKIGSDQNNNPNEFQTTIEGKQLHLLNNEMQHRIQKSNIFKHKYKVSLSNGSAHYLQEDKARALPSICSLKPEHEEKRSEEDSRLATLKKKLQSYNKTNTKPDQTVGHETEVNHPRYQSIQLKRNIPENKIVKPRANSTFKRILGDRERIKTHYDHQKKNIFFIPVSEYLKEYRLTVDPKPTPTIIRDCTKQKESAKAESEHIIPIDPQVSVEFTQPSSHSEKKYEAQEQDLTVTIYGIEPKKEMHNNTHKRFYGHGKEVKAEMKVIEKEVFQKFEFAPWQNLKEEATITNLDAAIPDS